MSRSAIRQHLQRCIPVALAAMIVSASGCSSVTFKRGAGPGQMANDEETCHASSSNDNRAFVTCMEARGWYVKIPDRVEQETAGESWMTKLRK
ncbi:MAG: hypothetical protein J4A00_08520, partial [Gammaproteobacteria bacterium]|nr:hypothetical protein [Gammaproteobacteria bacterium]